MSILDERKLTLVPFILEDEAEFWWDMIARTENVERMTWAAFKKLFLGKYFPQVERDARREEFEKLLQKGMTVAQYEAQFTELSRHAEYMVDTDEKKVSRFLRGLRPNIQSQLIMLMLTDYGDAVNRALLVERSLDERQRMYERSDSKRTSDRAQGSGGSFFKKQKGHQAAPQKMQKKGQSFQQKKPVGCDKCKMPGHSAKECRNCFQCGQPGHFSRRCPQRVQQGGAQQLQTERPLFAQPVQQRQPQN